MISRDSDNLSDSSVINIKNLEEKNEGYINFIIINFNFCKEEPVKNIKKAG